MKKAIYLLLLAAAPLAATAQSITLTTADAPQIGESWMEINDYRYGEHQLTPAGANQTWNYAASLQPSDTTYTNFVAISAVPANYSADFPNAQMATYTPGDTMAMFFKTNSSGFYVDGIGSDPVTMQGVSAGSFKFNPDRLAVPLPFTFGDTRSHVARMVIEGSQGPAQFRLVLHTVQNFSADAWGSLTTPSGTYANTLRIREYAVTRDSIYANFGGGWSYVPGSSNDPDTTISYTWYRNGLGARLLTVQEDAAAPGTSVSATYLSETMVAAPEQTTAQAIVYPNPVANAPVTFGFANENAYRLIISDMLGRQLKTEQVAGLNKLVLSTNQFGAGNYVYTVVDKQGAQISSGRFAVVK